MNVQNKIVQHKRYGRGKILSLNDNALTIIFQQYGTRTLRYPDVFSTDLTTEDSELAVLAEQALRNKNMQTK